MADALWIQEINEYELIEDKRIQACYLESRDREEPRAFSLLEIKKTEFLRILKSVLGFFFFD